jgi:hypothetical protein
VELAGLLLTAGNWPSRTIGSCDRSSRDVRRESPVAAAIHAAAGGPHAGNDRAVTRVYRGSLSWRPKSFAETRSLDRVAQNVQWEHDTLFPKYQLASDLSLVESYGSIKLVDHQILLFVARQFGPMEAGKSRLPQPTALRLFGTEFLVLPEASQPAFAERIDVRNRPSDWPENTSLWQMKRTLPRAWIVHDIEILAPLAYPPRIASVEDRSKQVLFPAGKARDFSRSGVVESDRPPVGLIEMLNDPARSPAVPGDETCRISHYDPQHVVIEATLAQPGLVVLSDAWYPGWKATYRWQPPGSAGATGPMEAQVLRTNRVLRGVWLPAGTSEIEMRYQPASFVRGAAISGASWALLIAAGMLVLTRRRRGAKATKGTTECLNSRSTGDS